MCNNPNFAIMTFSYYTTYVKTVFYVFYGNTGSMLQSI